MSRAPQAPLSGAHAMRLVPPDQATTVSLRELHDRLRSGCLRHTDEENAAFIADKIVMAEQMGIPTHGLHYFLHSIWPHLQQGRINDGPIRVSGSIVHSTGIGGIGFMHLQRCMSRASDIAQRTGVALAVLRMPGKVGALRVFCPDFTDRGQLVVMVKNTARTVGMAETHEPIFGTNPLCIGLPGTRFIYDSSVATVATNKVRLARKTGQRFPADVGVDEDLNPTADPQATVDAGGFLLPFSFGPYWYKSFFLGVAIEAMAALAGGSTGARVGVHTGSRLHSREGMLVLIVDRSALPEYEAYLEEVERLMGELTAHGLRIPGEFDRTTESADVLTPDWAALLQL